MNKTIKKQIAWIDKQWKLGLKKLTLEQLICLVAIEGVIQGNEELPIDDATTSEIDGESVIGYLDDFWHDFIKCTNRSAYEVVDKMNKECAPRPRKAKKEAKN